MTPPSVTACRVARNTENHLVLGRLLHVEQVHGLIARRAVPDDLPEHNLLDVQPEPTRKRSRRVGVTFVLEPDREHRQVKTLPRCTTGPPPTAMRVPARMSRQLVTRGALELIPATPEMVPFTDVDDTVIEIVGRAAWYAPLKVSQNVDSAVRMQVIVGFLDLASIAPWDPRGELTNYVRFRGTIIPSRHHGQLSSPSRPASRHRWRQHSRSVIHSSGNIATGKPAVGSNRGTVYVRAWRQQRQRIG